MLASTELPKSPADLTSMSLYTVVKVKNDAGNSWKEVADVISVSTSGAGFLLPRECEVGRLVSLMLPLLDILATNFEIRANFKASRQTIFRSYRTI